jgi:hypothetical protein
MFAPTTPSQTGTCFCERRCMPIAATVGWRAVSVRRYGSLRDSGPTCRMSCISTVAQSLRIPSCAGRRSGCLGLGSVLDTNSVPALADSDDRWVAELAVKLLSGQAGVAPHGELEQRLAASGRRAGGAPWVCRWTEGPLPTTEPKGGLGRRGLPVTALLGTHESRDGRGNAC